MDPFCEFAIDKVLDGLLGVAKIIIDSKSEGEELKKMLSPLKAVIDENLNLISKKISDSDPSSDLVKKLYEGFQARLEEGLLLVEKLEKIPRFNFLNRGRYGSKVKECRKKIEESMHTGGSPYVMHTVLNLTATVRDNERQRSDDVEKLTATVRDNERQRSDDVEKLTATVTDNYERQRLDVEKLTAAISNHERLILENVIPRMDNNSNSNALILQQLNTNQLSQTSIDGGQQSINSTFPDFVGLNNAIDDVRKILLQDDFDIVGITGMGGHGKTTLATALSNDIKVKEHFCNDIIFITVSQLDGDGEDLLNILGTMWDKIVGGPRPSFRNTRAVHSQLQQAIEQRTNRRTLVILDDVWSKSIAERLLFKAGGYIKTVITSRDDSIIPKNKGSYLHKMDILGEADALLLFCFWAFGKPSIPKTEKEDLVQEVAAKCHGSPLALKVTGSCLHGQPRPVWESAKADLSTGEYRNDYYKEELLDQLEKSIKPLDEDLKKCFLDLGAFPQGGTFSVDSLLDIWVYVRGMKSWEYACAVLLELASLNLLDLKRDSGSGAEPITYHCASELSFSQHDVMRDLALRLARRDSERLFMPCRDHKIPSKWQTPGDQSSCARFLSIHTGAMEEQDWCPINFGEVEALGLFFASTSSKYCLPTFLHTMPKLKVLIIYNYGSQRAVLSGLPSFPSLVEIRSVLLNKLIVPPLYENCKSWGKLEKLYVCLCEGLGSIPLVDNEPEALNFPNIIEINLDHCSDLEKLPVKLCNLTSLQTLSITNCHLVPELPDDLGRLSSLKVLRLSACPSLSRLPPSICKLRQLEYLDISLCSRLHNLPTGFDQLSKLETLDMRECSGFNNLPTFKLRSLKHLIISDSEKVVKRGEWRSANPNLTIYDVPEVFTLDWLFGSWRLAF